MAKNNYAEAAGDFQAALDADPDFKSARHNLNRAMAALNNNSSWIRFQSKQFPEVSPIYLPFTIVKGYMNNFDFFAKMRFFFLPYEVNSEAMLKN